MPAEEVSSEIHRGAEIQHGNPMCTDEVPILEFVVFVIMSHAAKSKHKKSLLLKEKIFQLTRNRFRSNFQYDVIVQDEIYVIPENESAYDYNVSILELF